MLSTVVRNADGTVTVSRNVRRLAAELALPARLLRDSGLRRERQRRGRNLARQSVLPVRRRGRLLLQHGQPSHRHRRAGLGHHRDRDGHARGHVRVLRVQVAADSGGQQVHRRHERRHDRRLVPRPTAASATRSPRQTQNPGTDTIEFNLPGPSLVITPTPSLPAITDGVVIDGTTQPGFSASSRVDVDGAGDDRRRLRRRHGCRRQHDSRAVDHEVPRRGHRAVRAALGRRGQLHRRQARRNRPRRKRQRLHLPRRDPRRVRGQPDRRHDGCGRATSSRRNNPSGIVITQGAGNVILGNRIGTNVDGDHAVPNAQNGIYLPGPAGRADDRRRRTGRGQPDLGQHRQRHLDRGAATARSSRGTRSASRSTGRLPCRTGPTESTPSSRAAGSAESGRARRTSSRATAAPASRSSTSRRRRRRCRATWSASRRPVTPSRRTARGRSSSRARTRSTSAARRPLRATSSRAAARATASCSTRLTPRRPRPGQLHRHRQHRRGRPRQRRRRRRRRRVAATTRSAASVPGAGNVISASSQVGVRLDLRRDGQPRRSATASAPTRTRRRVLANDVGIELTGTTGTIVGSAVPPIGNVIAGSTEAGIVLDARQRLEHLRRQLRRHRPHRHADFGNADGMRFHNGGGSNNVIGPTNVFAHNVDQGIEMNAGIGNRISASTFHDNGERGDLPRRGCEQRPVGTVRSTRPWTTPEPSTIDGIARRARPTRASSSSSSRRRPARESRRGRRTSASRPSRPTRSGNGSFSFSSNVPGDGDAITATATNAGHARHVGVLGLHDRRQPDPRRHDGRRSRRRHLRQRLHAARGAERSNISEGRINISFAIDASGTQTIALAIGAADHHEPGRDRRDDADRSPARLPASRRPLRESPRSRSAASTTVAADGLVLASGSGGSTLRGLGIQNFSLGTFEGTGAPESESRRAATRSSICTSERPRRVSWLGRTTTASSSPATGTRSGPATSCPETRATGSSSTEPSRGADDNVVTGNLVGTDSTGNAPLAGQHRDRGLRRAADDHRRPDRDRRECRRYGDGDGIDVSGTIGTRQRSEIRFNNVGVGKDGDDRRCRSRRVGGRRRARPTASWSPTT